MAKDLTSPDMYMDALKAFEHTLATTRASGAGMPMLLFAKGAWTVGVESEEIEIGTRLVLVPTSFKTGFIAWHMREIEGELMFPINEVPSDLRDKLYPVKAKQGWQPQLAAQFTFENDPEFTVEFKTSSIGGFDAMRKLIHDFREGFKDPVRVRPVVELGNDSYEHKEFGLVYKPTLTVVGWLPAEGEEVPKKIERKRDLL